jgi:hypothetical protein
MAKGDIIPLENSNSHGMPGGLPYRVASGTTASINPGEPVQKLAGAAGVTALLTNSPTATNRIVGVALSQSNETASADGTVQVASAAPGQIWLIAPKVASTWNTQAKYNALVGSRVLIDLTNSTYTILAADGAGNGCIVEYLDVARYPGMVAFSWSPLCDYRNV